MSIKILDCVIIGGGIAGLTAGIYLSRFNCKVSVIDNKASRARLIPCSHNFPGFPEGVTGKRILSKLKKQYDAYQNEFMVETVSSIVKKQNLFLIKGKNIYIKSKFVILATGLIDQAPDIFSNQSRTSTRKGFLRHCLICDGYEISGKKVLIISDNKSCIKQALLLKAYTDSITILILGKKIQFTSEEKKHFSKYNIILIDNEKDNCQVEVKNNQLHIKMKNKHLIFKVVYSALGVKTRSELAVKLGIHHDKDKCLIVNTHQETSLKGFYAAGDVVKGIKQMCIAASQGATAAIDIFNKLNV